MTLTFEEFNYGWANALDEVEAKQLYDEFHVAASGLPIFQADSDQLNPFSEIKVKFKAEDRGPMMVISRREGPHRPARDLARGVQEARKNNTPSPSSPRCRTVGTR